MITDGEKYHYLAAKNISRLLHRITSKHNDDGYWVSCLHLFRAKSKLKLYKHVRNNHNYCNVNMP